MKRFVCLLGLLTAGCGGSADSVPKAEASVRSALDVWKSGESADKLPAIKIVDPDWAAGYRLIDYSVKASTAQPQQGPRIVVTLNLKNKAGKTTSREVAYEVLDGNPIRIGRDAFHVE